MVFRRTSRWPGGVLLALMAVALAAGAAGAGLDQLVPEDVVSFAGVRSYTKLLAKLRASPLQDLMQAPEIAALIDTGLSDRAGLLGKLKDEAGLTREEVAALPGDEVAVALFRIKRGIEEMLLHEPELVPLLLVDVRANAQAARSAVDRLRAAAARLPGCVYTEEKIGGHAICHFVRKPPGQQAEHLYLSLEDGVLALLRSKRRQPMELCLAIRDGGDGTLSRSPLYQQVIRHVGDGSDYVTFQQFSHRWADMKERSRRTKGTGGVDKALGFEALGLFNIQAQGSGTTIGDDGLRVELFALVPRPRTGLPACLEPGEGFRPWPPPFVGGDVALYAGFYVDGPGVWEATLNGMQHMVPLAAMLAKQLLANPQADMNFEADILSGLGHHWFVYVPHTDEAGEREVVWGADIKEPETFQASLDRFMPLVALLLPMELTEFEGRKIYHSAGGKLQLFMGEKDVAPMAICAVGDHLVFARRAETIKQIIRDADRGEGPLATSPAFRRSLPSLARRPAAVLYADHRRLSGELWPALVGKLGQGGSSGFNAPKGLLSVQTAAAEWDEAGLILRSWIPFARQVEGQ